MKKLIAMLLSLAMLASAAACSHAEPKPEPTEPSVRETWNPTQETEAAETDPSESAEADPTDPPETDPTNTLPVPFVSEENRLRVTPDEGWTVANSEELAVIAASSDAEVIYFASKDGNELEISLHNGLAAEKEEDNFFDLAAHLEGLKAKIEEQLEAEENVSVWYPVGEEIDVKENGFTLQKFTNNDETSYNLLKIHLARSTSDDPDNPQYEHLYAYILPVIRGDDLIYITVSSMETSPADDNADAETARFDMLMDTLDLCEVDPT